MAKKGLDITTVALWTLIGCAATAAARAGSDQLKTGAAVERSIAGGAAHHYTVSAHKGQAVRAVVDQRGVDVVIKLTDPAGHEVGSFDSPNGDKGPEPVFFIAERDGTYRLDVAPLEAAAKEGKYEIRLVEVRAATRAEVESAGSLREVTAIDEAWEVAVAAVKADAMAQFMASDYQNFRAQGGQVPTIGKPQLLEPFRTGKVAPRKPGTKKTEERTVRVFGDTAVVMSRLGFVDDVNGRKVNSAIRAMHVWQRRAGRWLLVGDMVYPATPVAVAHKFTAVSADILQASTGTYEIAEQTNKLHATVDGDHLHVSVDGGGQLDLYPETDSEFFTKAGDIGCTFVRDGQGRVTHAVILIEGRAIRASRKD